MGVDWGQMAAGFAGGVVRQMDARDKEAADTRAEERAANRQLAMQERLMAAREMMETRAEERKQKLSASQGKQIDTEAKGMLSAGQADKMNEFYGDGQNLKPEDLSPEELATVKPSERETIKAKRDAASKLGMLSHSKEFGEQERLLVSDEDKKADNALKQKQYESDVEYKQGTLKINADKIAMQQQLGEARIALREAAAAAKDGTKDLPASKKILIDGYNKRISALEIELRSPTLFDPEKKAEIQAQMDRLQNNIFSLAGADPADMSPLKPAAPPPKAGRPPLDSFIRR